MISIVNIVPKDQSNETHQDSEPNLSINPANPLQIVATAFIVLYVTRYQDTPCPIHLPCQPTAKAATGTGTSDNELQAMHLRGTT